MVTLNILRRMAEQKRCGFTGKKSKMNPFSRRKIHNHDFDLLFLDDEYGESEE